MPVNLREKKVGIMKKTGFVLIICLISGIMIMAFSHPVMAEDGEGFKIGRKGKNLKITLISNASTGYGWQYEISDTSVLSLKDEKYIQKDTGDIPLCGAPGIQSYIFRAEKEGTVKITLTYLRPWDEASVLRTNIYTVKINKKGRITKVKLEQPKELRQ